MTTKRTRVAIFSPNENAPTETFIRAHIDRLPMDTVHIHGGHWHMFTGGKRVWPLLRYPGEVLRRIRPDMDPAVYACLLARQLRRRRIDVALAEYGVTGVDVLDACRKARIPLVVYFYGFDASCKPVIDQYRDGYRKLFAHAAAVVAISSSILARLIEWGAQPERSHYVVCGADPHKFAGARPEEAAAHFVAVGRFVEKKAPHLTVLAFRDVVAAHPGARLSMVGDGPLLGPTRRLAAALGIEAQVRFLGVRSPDNVSALLRTARAFVHHALRAEDGDSEGTPVSIVEAQMAGVPVIATRHEGIPEVVEDGVTGYLVAEGDAAAMGAAMTALACDPRLAGQLGRQARERALGRFSLELHVARVATILAEAAASANQQA